MRYSSHPRLMLEMALIKTAEADRVIPVAEILERLEGFQETREIKTDSRPQPQVTSNIPVREKIKKTAPEPPKAEVSTKEDKKTDEKVEPTPAKEKIEPPVKKTAAKTAPPVPSDEGPQKQEPVQPQTKDVRKHWDGFIEYVLDRKKWMAHTLRLCSSVREEDHNLVLKFDDPSECKMLKTPENIKFLTEFSQDFFQK
jgi:DNA polymerase-3 subunit gamma/tau